MESRFWNGTRLCVLWHNKGLRWTACIMCVAVSCLLKSLSSRYLLIINFYLHAVHVYSALYGAVNCRSMTHFFAPIYLLCLLSWEHWCPSWPDSALCSRLSNIVSNRTSANVSHLNSPQILRSFFSLSPVIKTDWNFLSEIPPGHYCRLLTNSVFESLAPFKTELSVSAVIVIGHTCMANNSIANEWVHRLVIVGPIMHYSCSISVKVLQNWWKTM